MKPKEWLLANGHIKEITRGRISRDNHTLIEAAVRNGASIEGYSVSTAPAVSKSEAKPATVVKKVSTTNEKVIAEVAAYRYPEEEYVAYEYRDGKRVERSLRSACNRCGYSLVGCWCTEPCIAAHDGSGSVRIYVERK